MEAVRQWALSVCMACICVGILQQFSQNRSNFSVIKLVLTLYILVTAFAPLNNFQLAEINLSIPAITQESEVIDTKQIIYNQTKFSVTNMIIDACAANNLHIKDVNVNMTLNNDNISIIDVELIVNENTDVNKAIQVTKNTLNLDVPVKIINGG